MIFLSTLGVIDHVRVHIFNIKSSKLNFGQRKIVGSEIHTGQQI